jgi:hypothetical protein
MARARNIKPGFFKNETLGSLPPLARILFAGLWTIADRAGRLEDRPQRIKLEVLGYDDCDVDALLQALHDRGFILRYHIGEVPYIQILAWGKHQNPHVKEVPSTIQAPSPHQISLGKHSASTGKSGTSTAFSGASPSLTLIPSSLIPLTLNPEHRADKSDQKESRNVSDETVNPWDSDFDFEVWFEQMWARHPNKNYKTQARQTLGSHPQVFDPEWRAKFEAAQDAWRVTDSWRWNNGAKCPHLYQWVNDEGYEFLPEAPLLAKTAAASTKDDIWSNA